jgi:hypothetical protein
MKRATVVICTRDDAGFTLIVFSAGMKPRINVTVVLLPFVAHRLGMASNGQPAATVGFSRLQGV